MPKSVSLVRPEIRSILPYNAGLTLQEVRDRFDPPQIAKLGSNENPLGPSPAVAASLANSIELFRLYPDPSGRELAQRLAADFAVSDSRIILGNGSEDLIAVVARTVLRPGDRVITLYPSFPLHEDYATLMGAKVDRVGLRADLSIDTEALLAAVAGPARMVIFANPMNPVGSWLTSGELGQVIAAVDDNALIVIDEAYAEYAAGNDYSSALPLLERSGKPWVVLRTFSKAYGLAGLRIGFGVVSDPELRSYLDRARTPFNTNAIAQAAAVLALGDTDHLHATVAHATRERERVKTALLQRGLRVAPSKGNFLFIDVGRNGSIVAEALLRQGVIVKPWKQPGYENFIRVSIGTSEENDLFTTALASALRDHSS
ncbi:Histidinol-phosphate aminotransferase [Ensifer psoraleae]|uniref:histidinol-phosphate transaminase n=1 Tax=Sinorhizobium TaxID=28105 RepID=UPI001568B5BA|nr:MULTISPECIES: histidinol-phosphate transaminase [Sinorhizobium]MDK1389556.1 histidinol-phosphate transaminase [Sinorhizobium sp. 7-81]NRP74621.1 Histidinol-phosphate aminotransferase [Sinorhizobium psoraleae]